MKLISQGIKDLGKQMIEKPHDWIQGEFEFCNKIHRDIRIWTTSGVLFIEIGGLKGMNIFEKYYINRCIKQSIANRLKYPAN